MSFLDKDQPEKATSSPVLDAIKGVEYPVTLAGLKIYARQRGADGDTLAILDGMPDRAYTTLREINAVLGIHESVEGHENVWSPAGSQELEGEARKQ